MFIFRLDIQIRRAILIWGYRTLISYYVYKLEKWFLKDDEAHDQHHFFLVCISHNPIGI